MIIAVYQRQNLDLESHLCKVQDLSSWFSGNDNNRISAEGVYPNAWCASTNVFVTDGTCCGSINIFSFPISHVCHSIPNGKFQALRNVFRLENCYPYLSPFLSVINLLDLINSLKSFYFPIFFIHFSLLEFPIPTRIRSLFVSSNCPETLKICNCSSTIQYLWKTTLYGFGCH